MNKHFLERCLGLGRRGKFFYLFNFIRNDRLIKEKHTNLFNTNGNLHEEVRPKETMKPKYLHGKLHKRGSYGKVTKIYEETKRRLKSF